MLLKTVKELHVALDLELQYLNSNRLKQLDREEKDWYLNQAVLSFISSKISIEVDNADTYGKTKNGFEDTIKKYSDLEPLKKTRVLPLYIDPNDTARFGVETFSLLPSDYLAYVTSSTKSISFCTEETVPITTIQLPGYKKTGILQGNTPMFVTDTVTSIDKLNNYLSGVNKNTVFFEEVKIGRTEQFYEPDTLFDIKYLNIADGSLIQDATLSHVEVQQYNPLNLEEYVMYGTRNRLVSSEIADDMLDTSYHKPSASSSIVTLEDTNIFVYNNGLYKPLELRLTYIKRPRQISFKLNTMHELWHRNNEIVKIAAQTIKARLGDQSYQMNALENKLVE